MRFIKALSAVLIATHLTGCYTLQYNGTYLADDSASFSRQKGAKVERTIHAEDRATYLISGLIPLSTPNIEQVLRREAGSRKVQAVRIQSQMGVMDILLSVGCVLLIGAGIGAASGGNPQTMSLIQPAVFLLAPQFRTVTVDAEVIAD